MPGTVLMAPRKTPLTADVLFRRYSYTDGRYKPVDGEVAQTAPLNEQHGEVAGNMNGA